MQKIGLLLLIGFLASLTIASINVATHHIPPVTLTAVRLFIASTVFVGLLAYLKPVYRWHSRGVFDLALVSFLNVALPNICLAIALRHISGSLAATLLNTTPIFTMIAAHYLLNDEKLSWAKVMGGLVAVVGASVLLLSKSTGLANLSQGWLGQGLVILASLASALGVVYTRIHLRHENVFVITAGQVFTSLLLAAPVALLIEGLPAANSYGWQGWLAVTSAAFFGPVLLYGLVFYMINQYGASLAGFAGITTPFFSLVIGLLFLGEVLTLPMAVGIVCLSVGVWSLNYF